MRKSHSVVQAAITGLLAIGAGSLATAAYAGDDHGADEVEEPAAKKSQGLTRE